MKKTLLISLLIISQVATAQLYLNEIMVDPPGTDNPNEFIELRGIPNATLTNTYLMVIEGDGSDPGDVNEVIDLSGLTIGSNGYLVLLTTGHPYTVDPNATIALDLTDGELEGQSHTFILIESATTPSTSDDIDSDNDGTPDGTPYTDWTILDSIALLRDNDSSGEAYAYSLIGFLEDDTSQTDPTLYAPSGATIIVTTGAQFDYVARIGNSTGAALTNDESTSDWVGGDLPSGNLPNWSITTNTSKVYPSSFAGSELNHIGSANPTTSTLSTGEISKLSFSMYPNPASNTIQISTNKELNKVEVFNLIGNKVIVEADLVNNSVDISSLAKGVYILKIFSGISTITKKIIKE